MSQTRTALAAFAVLSVLKGCTTVQAPTKPPSVEESPSLQRIRQVFARIPEVLARNYQAFEGPKGPVSGFGAGEAYPQIWLRDSAWIVDAAAANYPKEALTSWLDLHLAHASTNGRLRDWVAKGSAEAFRKWAPQAQSKGPIAFDTNTNESDQESSAALAHCRAEDILGPKSAQDDLKSGGRTSKLLAAMDALIRDRTDPKTGLLWSGLTADWGDVSPLYPDQRAIYLDSKTPRTLSLYSNVMAYEALHCLSSLSGPKSRRDRLAARSAQLRERIRSAFWMKDRGYFRIRRTLDAVPKDFGEDDDHRFALGGNSLAALFGVAEEGEATSIFETAERLRTTHQFTTVSTVLIPPYAKGVFQHPAMREPFQYQNGGQWDWFGAALVEAEFERGHAERARRHLDQIASRTLAAGRGIHEWYAVDGSPRGSAAYAASAAAIYNAIVKGLLGVSRSPAGYRIVVRTAETLLPFEIPQGAASRRLVVSQTVGDTAVEIHVLSNAPVKEVCSTLREGKSPDDLGARNPAMPQSVHQLGQDTIICADVTSAPLPIRVRFAVH